MKKLFLAAFLILTSLSVAHAQAPSSFPYVKLVPNDTVTGTTQFTLTKINASGNAVVMAPTDTNGYTGVCVSNCGTVGSAWIAFAGIVPLKVDGTTTNQHYILISTSVGGDGHDSGATTYPPAGSGDVIGRIAAPSTSSGSFSMVDLGPEIIPAPSGTITVCSGTITLGTTAIASGAKSTLSTTTCTGLLTSDNIKLDFSSDPSAVTGYAPSASGMLTLVSFPTANTINLYQYNNTGASITPGAMTLNYRVTR